MAGDVAHAFREERVDPLGGRPPVHQDDAGGHRPRRRAAERDVVLVQDAQPGADEDADRRGGEPPVRSGDGDGVDRSPRAGDAPVARSGATVVSGRDDRQRVEIGRARDRAGQRPVRERGVRLDHADERDPRRVLDVAVGVRVDRCLEPGEDLVRPRIDAVAALGVRLPASDANRQDRRARRDPVQAARPFRPGDDAGELGRMSLGASGDRGMGLRDPTASGVDHVDARDDALPQIGMRRVDSGVEKGDRDPRAVEPCDLEIRDGGRQHSAVARLTRLRRVRDADRIDPQHLTVGVEERQRGRIEAGGKPVDDARVAVLWRDPRADRGQPCEELLLLRDLGRRPGSSLLLGGAAPCRPDLLRERSRLEQHDVALRGGHRSAHSEHALPTRLVDRRRGRLLRVPSARAEDERRGRRPHEHRNRPT